MKSLTFPALHKHECTSCLSSAKLQYSMAMVVGRIGSDTIERVLHQSGGLRSCPSDLLVRVSCSPPACHSSIDIGRTAGRSSSDHSPSLIQQQGFMIILISFYSHTWKRNFWWKSFLRLSKSLINSFEEYKSLRTVSTLNDVYEIVALEFIWKCCYCYLSIIASNNFRIMLPSYLFTKLFMSERLTDYTAKKASHDKLVLYS